MKIPDSVISSLDGIGFKLTTKDNVVVFGGTINAGNISVPIEIEIRDWDFINLPIVRIDKNFVRDHKLRAHVTTNNVLCYSDPNTFLLDRYQPDKSMMAVIKHSKHTLHKILHENTSDLRPKFPPHFCRVLVFDLMALRGQFVH